LPRLLESPDLWTEAAYRNIMHQDLSNDQLQPSTPRSKHNNSSSCCSPWQRVPNVSQVSYPPSVWSWRESCQYHRNLTPPDTVSPSSICRCISSTITFCSGLYDLPYCFQPPLSPLYPLFTSHHVLVVLCPFRQCPSGVLPQLKSIAAASLRRPNQASLGKEGWCISSH
jgi:hypothetical protein